MASAAIAASNAVLADPSRATHDQDGSAPQDKASIGVDKALYETPRELEAKTRPRQIGADHHLRCACRPCRITRLNALYQLSLTPRFALDTPVSALPSLEENVAAGCEPPPLDPKCETCASSNAWCDPSRLWTCGQCDAVLCSYRHRAMFVGNLHPGAPDMHHHAGCTAPRAFWEFFAS